MNKTTEVVEKTNLTPVIALLVLNLLAVLFTLGAVLSRTAGLSSANGGSDNVAVSVDRVGDIRLHEGNVVFDLINIDGTNPKIEKQVTMSQDGFVRGYASMEQFVNKMIEQGLVTANEEAASLPVESE
jgi:hypothetical protein